MRPGRGRYRDPAARRAAPACFSSAHRQRARPVPGGLGEDRPEDPLKVDHAGAVRFSSLRLPQRPFGAGCTTMTAPAGEEAILAAAPDVVEAHAAWMRYLGTEKEFAANTL